MRTIAAWLSLWDDAVRSELMKREPEALLTLGDPESLGIADRVSLLGQFAAMYGPGGRRGLNVPLAEVRRLAHPALAPTIRTLWGGGKGPTNHDVRELLIELLETRATIAANHSEQVDFADFLFCRVAELLEVAR